MFKSNRSKCTFSLLGIGLGFLSTLPEHILGSNFLPPSNIIQKTVSLIIHTECTGGDESIKKCPAFLNSAVDACAQKGHTVVLLFL